MNTENTPSDHGYEYNENQQYESQQYDGQDNEHIQEEAVYAAPPVFGVKEEIYGESSYEDENYYEQPYQQQEEYHQPEETQYYYEQEQENTHYENHTYNEEYDEEDYKEEDSYYEKRRRKKNNEVVSTNQSINLTCTLAAFFGLFGLFLYFADQRSNAVRRISVQSSALFIGEVVVFILLWLIGAIFSVIPFIGILMKVIVWLAAIATIVIVVFLKYQMMLRAYRGEAYVLPVIGEHIRRFE